MKDAELKKLLGSARVPNLPEAYWRDFPSRVTARLNQQGTPSEAQTFNTGSRFKLCLTWGLTVAAVCVGIAFIIRIQPKQAASVSESTPQLAEARKCYHELEALFPNQLRAIVFDQHEPQVMLAERAVVPDSTPYYLRICSPGGCRGVVTFSGEQIQINGQSCEVLADGHGKVMLVGNDHVWQENNPTESVRIQATPLEGAL